MEPPMGIPLSSAKRDGRRCHHPWHVKDIPKDPKREVQSERHALYPFWLKTDRVFEQLGSATEGPIRILEHETDKQLAVTRLANKVCGSSGGLSPKLVLEKYIVWISAQ